MFTIKTKKTVTFNEDNTPLSNEKYVNGRSFIEDSRTFSNYDYVHNIGGNRERDDVQTQVENLRIELQKLQMLQQSQYNQQQSLSDIKKLQDDQQKTENIKKDQKLTDITNDIKNLESRLAQQPPDSENIKRIESELLELKKVVRELNYEQVMRDNSLDERLKGPYRLQDVMQFNNEQEMKERGIDTPFRSTPLRRAPRQTWQPRTII